MIAIALSPFAKASCTSKNHALFAADELACKRSRMDGKREFKITSKYECMGHRD
jgi:hypothetical protein